VIIILDNSTLCTIYYQSHTVLLLVYDLTWFKWKIVETEEINHGLCNNLVNFANSSYTGRLYIISNKIKWWVALKGIQSLMSWWRIFFSRMTTSEIHEHVTKRFNIIIKLRKKGQTETRKQCYNQITDYRMIWPNQTWRNTYKGVHRLRS